MQFVRCDRTSLFLSATVCQEDQQSESSCRTRLDLILAVTNVDCDDICSGRIQQW